MKNPSLMEVQIKLHCLAQKHEKYLRIIVFLWGLYNGFEVTQLGPIEKATQVGPES